MIAIVDVVYKTAIAVRPGIYGHVLSSMALHLYDYTAYIVKDDAAACVSTAHVPPSVDSRRISTLQLPSSTGYSVILLRRNILKYSHMGVQRMS